MTKVSDAELAQFWCSDLSGMWESTCCSLMRHGNMRSLSHKGPMPADVADACPEFIAEVQNWKSFERTLPDFVVEAAMRMDGTRDKIDKLRLAAESNPALNSLLLEWDGLTTSNLGCSNCELTSLRRNFMQRHKLTLDSL